MDVGTRGRQDCKEVLRVGERLDGLAGFDQCNVFREASFVYLFPSRYCAKVICYFSGFKLSEVNFRILKQ